MVEQAAELGELLKLPLLEQETTALINAKMREFIGEVKPTPPEIKQEVESIMAEWLGAQKEGE
jgi:DNA recombination-dependent growth factor C